ncbi:MAG: hypothetical protein OXU36_02350, partial [Candidatus Poribacteria bacterium]|nr:hypothetical protein [Candidatus Poribacteria bacterium]
MQTLLSTGRAQNLLIFATGFCALGVFILMGCGTAEEDPLEPATPQQTHSDLNPTQMSAIPAAPPAPTDG